MGMVKPFVLPGKACHHLFRRKIPKIPGRPGKRLVGNMFSGGHMDNKPGFALIAIDIASTIVAAEPAISHVILSSPYGIMGIIGIPYPPPYPG